MEKEYGQPDEYFMIDEELPLTEKMKKSVNNSGYIPDGFRFATSKELGSKAQTEYIRTGMEGVEDPRITDIYVHPEDVKYKVNYRYVDDGKIVRSQEFSDESGKTIDLNTSKYTGYIYEGFDYAKDSDLKPGQVQAKQVVVEKDKEYDIYISKNRS